MAKTIIVTGGAGFIGSALIRYLINNTDYSIINIDKLTYAGNLESLNSIDKSDRYFFENIDICSFEDIERCFEKYQPDAVMHLAAESHVDKSISGPREFIFSNVLGTYTLLEQSKTYWSDLKNSKKDNFRFHHVSTDEVFGDLQKTGNFFSEETAYNPSSPYSASKAGSDHLVRAWGRTYGLPILVTNCSNNYGPYQFPEKLIPLTIINALKGMPIPIYGSGEQIRDWLFVDDHVRALVQVLKNGKLGETYNIGSNNEKSNLSVVNTICSILDELSPSHSKKIKSYKELISFVEDRPGGDFRYAINADKISNELNWNPIEDFDSGLRKTVEWYLSNQKWWKAILDGSYKKYKND